MNRIVSLLRIVWEARPTLTWTAGSGRWCRVCGEEIQLADGFGMAEGVCPACRADQAV